VKICVAPDSFKESLTAVEAAEWMARGVRRACPDCEIDAVPMADGGEGTVAALVNATGGSVERAEVTGPLGERVEAAFGVLGDGATAVIEMAAASGLELVPPGRRNPMLATTYGTGELIGAALDTGARRIIVGIGGSATVDGGVGMAQALGAHFCDESGDEVGRGGQALADIARIDLTHLDGRACRSTIEVACDVDNPLTGPSGAAPVYGPQKGATAEMVERLDRNLAHLAAVVRRDLGRDVEHIPGAGAAGGLGAGLVAFLGARLRPGVEIVMEAVGLRRRMAGCDLVITGEGKLDAQTAHGKAPAGVAGIARELNVPVLALAGSVEDHDRLAASGFTACFSIVDRPMTADEAFGKAGELLARAAERAMAAFLAGRGIDVRIPRRHPFKLTNRHD